MSLWNTTAILLMQEQCCNLRLQMSFMRKRLQQMSSKREIHPSKEKNCQKKGIMSKSNSCNPICPPIGICVFQDIPLKGSCLILPKLNGIIEECHKSKSPWSFFFPLNDQFLLQKLLAAEEASFCS